MKAGEKALYGLSVTAALVVFWLLLSGHYALYMILVGLLAAALVVLFSGRMAIIDHEGHPIYLLGRAVTFWPWLVWEIIKSAIAVTRVILAPALPISPTMVTVRGTQKTAVGLVIYANAITLTPGTISVDVVDNDITVHALLKAGAEDLEGGGMDRRVTCFEGGNR
ncbi:MAG: cation transporter [Alphaproteobacteria bacterium]|nr:cation transporter [Alphaproteobacteria bacterium]